MKIAILGYGKMGHEIEKIILQRGHEVTLRSCTHKPFLPADLKGTDVAIEFSVPAAAPDNILKCFDAKCPVVVGTTGWHTRLPEIREIALAQKQAILYSTNFSIGVNVLFHLNRELARIMQSLPEYDASITEIHHIHKLDKPSGTAITLAEGVIDGTGRKNKWVSGQSMDDNELSIESIREDEVPGTHTVKYESDVDTITLHHEAKSRQGFALGAVKAAEWLHGKTGVFTMHDYLKF